MAEYMYSITPGLLVTVLSPNENKLDWPHPLPSPDSSGNSNTSDIYQTTSHCWCTRHSFSLLPSHEDTYS